MFHATRPLLTNMMVSWNQKRRNWKGELFLHMPHLIMNGDKACFYRTKLDNVKLREDLVRQNKKLEEMFELLQKQIQNLARNLDKQVAKSCFRGSSIGGQCVSRPASWMRDWTLSSPRFGSFGSESSQVAEIFDVRCQTLIKFILTVFSSWNNLDRCWESRKELRGNNEHSKDLHVHLLPFTTIVTTTTNSWKFDHHDNWYNYLHHHHCQLWQLWRLSGWGLGGHPIQLSQRELSLFSARIV